jgi:proline dehydrogenase
VNRLSQATNAALRKAILAAAGSARLGRFVTRHGMRLGAGRFVAGVTLDDAVRVLRRLNDDGLHANTTLLGEGTGDEAGARAVVEEYRAILRRIAEERLRCNVALKLTHLGLPLDEELAHENVEAVVREAAAQGNFVRIDMEDSPWVDATLRIFRRLREAGHDNVGTVLQAYLYRTERDFDDLAALEPNLRIVKGAYLEPPEVAYPRKGDVDAAYARLVERSLERAGHTAVATHDEAMIRHAISYAERTGIPRERFELQMLFGVRSARQRELAREGHKVLVATPFGPDWYPYLMRRLAERPANLLFFLRSLVQR